MGKGIGTIAGAAIGGSVGFMIGGPAGAVALGAAGAQAGASLDAADAEKKAAKEQQGFLNQQADEVLRRAYQNMESTRIESIESEGNTSSQLAGSGVQVGSLSSLVAMETTAGRYREEMNNIYEDAKQNATAMRYQGQAAVTQARRQQQAAVISGGIGIIGAGASAYMKTPAGGPSELKGTATTGGSYKNYSTTA